MSKLINTVRKHLIIDPKNGHAFEITKTVMLLKLKD